MRKALALFLIMISFGIVFAGAVSAQEVDVAVINEDGTPVDVTSPGDEVAVEVNASANDSFVEYPAVFIYVDPETGLTFEPEKAMMWDGFEYIPNDLDDPFFFWSNEWDTWVWNIGDFWGDMSPGEQTQLIAPAIVTDVGPIKVTGDFMEWPEDLEEPFVIDSDSFTFLSVPAAAGETVPMQPTGAPVALAALGLLGIIGGAVYGRLR